jgi:hypothetical protein
MVQFIHQEKAAIDGIILQYVVEFIEPYLSFAITGIIICPVVPFATAHHSTFTLRVQNQVSRQARKNGLESIRQDDVSVP